MMPASYVAVACSITNTRRHFLLGMGVGLGTEEVAAHHDGSGRRPWLQFAPSLGAKEWATSAAEGWAASATIEKFSPSLGTRD